MKKMIKDLKVGDRLPDEPKSKYGQYVDIVVSSISITKKGRYNIEIDCTFVFPNGARKPVSKFKYSNGALSGNGFVDFS